MSIHAEGFESLALACKHLNVGLGVAVLTMLMLDKELFVLKVSLLTPVLEWSYNNFLYIILWRAVLFISTGAEDDRNLEYVFVLGMEKCDPHETRKCEKAKWRQFPITANMSPALATPLPLKFVLITTHGLSYPPCEMW